MAEGSTGAGTRIYLCTTANSAADTKSVYSALSYVEIGSVESVSEFGDSAQSVTYMTLADGRVKKAKGGKDAGDVSVTCIHDPLNVGQNDMITAEGTNFQYAFKVVLADAADANDTDSTFYFRARVMSKRLNPGDNNNVIKRVFVLGIVSQPVEDLSDAVSGP
jgi:hypothetical protein